MNNAHVLAYYNWRFWTARTIAELEQFQFMRNH
jgi:hypothetical protein